MDGWDGLDWISEGRWLKELSVGIEIGFQESRGWQGKGEPDKVGWVVVEVGPPLVRSLNILVYVCHNSRQQLLIGGWKPFRCDPNL